MRRASSSSLPVILTILLAHASVAAAQPTTGTQPARSTDELDAQANALFEAKRYREAIPVLQKLHAETRDPVYLRNMGRCQQLLRRPDQAIASFRRYLNEEEKVEDRALIEGYIREMEALKRDWEERAASARRALAENRPAEALTLAQALHAESGDSVHLLSIARAYEASGDLERALASARRFSEQARNPTPARREEAAALVRQIEEKRSASQIGSPASAPPAATAAMAAPNAPAPPPPAAPPPTGAVGAAPATPAPSPGAPLVATLADRAADDSGAGMSGRRIVGITLMAVAGALAVAGGVALSAAWSEYNAADRKGCGTTRVCETDAWRVGRYNKLSIGLLAGAALSGGTGLTLFILGAPPSSERARSQPEGLVAAVHGRF